MKKKQNNSSNRKTKNHNWENHSGSDNNHLILLIYKYWNLSSYFFFFLFVPRYKNINIKDTETQQKRNTTKMTLQHRLRFDKLPQSQRHRRKTNKITYMMKSLVFGLMLFTFTKTGSGKCSISFKLWIIFLLRFFAFLLFYCKAQHENGAYLDC